MTPSPSTQSADEDPGRRIPPSEWLRLLAERRAREAQRSEDARTDRADPLAQAAVDARASLHSEVDRVRTEISAMLSREAGAAEASALAEAQAGTLEAVSRAEARLRTELERQVESMRSGLEQWRAEMREEIREAQGSSERLAADKSSELSRQRSQFTETVTFALDQARQSLAQTAADAQLSLSARTDSELNRVSAALREQERAAAENLTRRAARRDRRWAEKRAAQMFAKSTAEIIQQGEEAKAALGAELDRRQEEAAARAKQGEERLLAVVERHLGDATVRARVAEDALSDAIEARFAEATSRADAAGERLEALVEQGLTEASRRLHENVEEALEAVLRQMQSIGRSEKT